MTTDVVKSRSFRSTHFNSRSNWPDRVRPPQRIPGVNITESKDDYIVSMAVPGMKRNDFKIDLDAKKLTIATDKEERREEVDVKYRRKESDYSSFHRSFTLPNDVKPGEIQATYDNGVLWLLVPKKDYVSKAARKKGVAVK